MSIDRQEFLQRNKEHSALQLKKQKRANKFHKIGKWLKPRPRGCG